jgi:hypothetical protein
VLLAGDIVKGSYGRLNELELGRDRGAELDVIGYLTGRYFGMAAFGRIYGALYMFCATGTAISPIFYGLAIDWSGAYTAGLWVGAAMLVISAILLYVLPIFRLESSWNVKMIDLNIVIKLKP